MLVGISISACASEPPEDSTLEAEDVSTTTQELAFGNISNSIVARHSGQCMVAPALGTGPVTQQPCQSTGTHWWKIVQSPLAPGYYSIENNNGSGRCLDVGSASTNGLDLVVAPCNLQSSQLFAVDRTAQGEWRIQPRNGVPFGMCLDVEGGGANPGARLQQYTCKTIDVENQRFLAVPLQQAQTLVGCRNNVALEVGPLVGSLFTLNHTNIANFSAAGFGYRCFEAGTPLHELAVCPAGTNLIEISRNYPDQFRVKCGRS